MTFKDRWITLAQWILNNIKDFKADPDSSFFGSTLTHPNNLQVQIVGEKAEGDEDTDYYYKVFINNHEIDADLGEAIRKAWKAELERRSKAAEEEILNATLEQLSEPMTINLNEYFGTALTPLYSRDVRQLWQLHQDNIHTTVFSKGHVTPLQIKYSLTFNVGLITVRITVDDEHSRFVAELRDKGGCYLTLNPLNRADLLGILSEIKHAILRVQPAIKP